MNETITITCANQGIWPCYVVLDGSYMYLPIDVDGAFDYVVNVLGARVPIIFDDSCCEVSK